MKLKIVLLIIIWLISGAFVHLYSQNTEVFASKREINFDEKVEIRYEINSPADSIRLSTHNGLKVVGAPSKSRTTTMVNGVKTFLKTWTYVFRPSDTGTVTIHAPVFYQDGKEILGEEITIHISGDLDSAQLKRLQFKAFKEDAAKPDQTMRYIVSDDFGYMEISENGKWIYLRRLTEEEMNIIRKLK